MDTGMLFGVLTSVLLATFVGGWIWAWRPGRRAVFEAAARMPLEDEADARQDNAVAGNTVSANTASGNLQ